MLLLSTAIHAHAQTKQLTVPCMQKDLALLWDAVQEVHPAYGLYTPADSLLEVYDQTIRSINHPLSVSEFIAATYPLISALKCGHTQLKYPLQYTPAAADRLPRLPFQVLVQQGRAWVTTHQLKEVSTGEELLSINSIPVKEIIKHGGDLYAADGNNQTFKELFLSEYDGFEDACNKYYHWQPPYIITLQSKQGVVRTISVDTLPITAPAQEPLPPFDNYKDWHTSANTDYLPLRFFKDSATAWLEVHTYQYDDTLIYNKAFREIRENKVRNLIIDLRHNTGGDIRIAAHLLAYLASGPFQMVGDLWARVPDPGKTNFDPYFDSLKTSSFKESFQPTGIKKNNRYPVEFHAGFRNLLQPINLEEANHFNGNLIVLIDGATFSSGAHTAAAIRQYCNNATFIGRETDGGSEGCSGGTIQCLTLPNSKVVVEFPLLRVVSVLRHPVYGHGVMPDITVTYTAAQVVTQEDRDLQEALNLLANKAHTWH